MTNRIGGRTDPSCLTRRTALKGAALAAGLATIAATAGTGGALAQARRRTFVLIHGAFHGGWCWRHVADILEAKGHKVYAPSLTGLADRSHLLSMSVNLDTHIADIVNLFRWEDLEDVCLVGHSYGGWPISGAAEQLVGKISSFVVVDGFLPENGEKGADFISAQFQEVLRDAIAKGVPGRPIPKAEQFGVMGAKNIAWVQAKMTSQPTSIATSTIKLTGARERIARKTYIRAHQYKQPHFDRYLARTKADASWRTIEMPATETGHDIMVDAPQRLAEILMQAA